MEKLDPMEIYDPALRGVPKTKSIFKITKEIRSGSLNSFQSNKEVLIDSKNEIKTSLIK